MMHGSRAVVCAALVTLVLGTIPSLGQDSPLVTGEVVRIDEPAGKISIKHGAISTLNLNENGKTDDFRPKDGLLFNALKMGDKIRFTAERTNGELTIVKVEKQ
jgi:Cu(I)/Ag(I) efflux system protein CusF